MKAKRIVVEYEDGSVRSAKDTDAEKIMAWWNGCELFCANHGMKYDGPRLKQTTPPKMKSKR
jgi:hypothetical protein